MRDLKISEMRVVIDFFLQGKVTNEILAIQLEAWRGHATSYDKAKIWVAHFERVDFTNCLRLVLDDPKLWPTRALLKNLTS